MASFNELLRKEGIDPADVALLRHQTERRGRTPHWLWENDRPGFYLYQSTQQDLPIFRKPYWASFVSPAKHQTMFVGLFEAKVRPETEIHWRDPLGGGPVGEGKDVPYFYYQCNPSSVLSGQIGSLRIEWGNAQRQWTQYAANDDKQIVGASRGVACARRQSESGHALGLERTLSLLGFNCLHRTKKLSMLQNAAGIVIYLKNETARCSVVIHPYYDEIRDRLQALPGIALDDKRAFYINSNLSAFPIYRDPARTTFSRYGIALDAEDAASIARLVALLRENRTIATPLGEVEFGGQGGRSGPTEREALCLARIGQGQFRLDCNQLWQWRCALSQIAIQELLRASHIKAWHEANDTERLDPYNGLLLAAHVDALFDRHLISFDDDGRLLVSSRIGRGDLLTMGIEPERAQIKNLHVRHRAYLAHHRKRLIR